MLEANLKRFIHNPLFKSNSLRSVNGVSQHCEPSGSIAILAIQKP